MKKIYIIGEIGQNHNGSVDIAKLIIDFAAQDVVDKLFGKNLRRMDAIKLTKRDLAFELSASQMLRPYSSVHSFGATYGEHRKRLELSDNDHFELYQYAKEKGLDVVETLCAPSCLSMLKLFTPDSLKVASRDLTNLPLLAALADTRIPIILSTGMAGKKELNEALDIITKVHNNISILHCVSQYPTEYNNVNLNTIKFLQKQYSQYKIGYSDHTVGVAMPVAAVAMGAEIIEKHITLDRRMKGTDQAGSLGIDGVERMVRDIRNMESAFGEEDIFVCEGVKGAREKLERSIAARHRLDQGALITEGDLHMLSPGDGYKWADRALIIGKRLTKTIEKDELIYPSDLK